MIAGLNAGQFKSTAGAIIPLITAIMQTTVVIKSIIFVDDEKNGPDKINMSR